MTADLLDGKYFLWRQGSVIPESFVRSKGWLDETGMPYFAIVVTHDCDCVAACEREPYLEILLGRKIDSADGSLTNAKSTRRLHLAWTDTLAGSEQMVELLAEPKSAILKKELFGIAPSAGYTLSSDHGRTLTRWLRARYDRATFPDEFIKRLSFVAEKIERATKTPVQASALHGLYFYHDPEGEISDPAEPYSLNIVVLFDSSKEGAADVAHSVAESLRESFERKYKTLETPDLGIQWNLIELSECEPVSDEDFTFVETLSYKLYRLDYISLRQSPQVPIPDAA